MSRSPLSRKENYSKLHWKSQAAVPKRFPAEILKPKTNQPIESIHKIWNFVKPGKTTEVNKSTHLTSVNIPESNAEQKNFSFSKNADPVPPSRDKTPPSHMHSSKSGTNLHAHGRPPNTDVANSNFRPFLYSKANQNSHHERKVSDIPRSMHRVSPSKGSRPQSISNGNIFLVPSQQQDRYHRTKHNSYASIYANNHQADHTTRDISPSYAKDRRKENASHNKSKSSITPLKNENPSPEFNFESPLSTNRPTNDKSLSRDHSRGYPSAHSPIENKGRSVDRRLKYTPNAYSQPQSVWETNPIGVDNEFLEISNDSLLNRSVLDGHKLNIDREASIRDNNKNPTIKSLNLQKLRDIGEEQAYLDPGNHFRSFSGIINNSQIHQKENISADRYLHEFKQQVQKASNSSYQNSHNLASGSIDNPKSIYHQVIDDKKKVSNSNSTSNIPTGTNQKSFRAGLSLATVSEQHNTNAPQNGLGFTFQNYLAPKGQNKSIAPASKTTHSSHLDQQHSQSENHQYIDSWNSNAAIQRQVQQKQQQHQQQKHPNTSSLSNFHHSVNYPLEVVYSISAEHNEMSENSDNPINSRVKRTMLHHYRTNENSTSQPGKLPNKSSSRPNLVNPEPKPSSKKHRRNPVHQSMGQISQSFSQETRATGTRNPIKMEAYSSNANTRSPDLHSKNPAPGVGLRPQTKLLNNFVKDADSGPPSHMRQKTLSSHINNSMLGIRPSKDQVSKRSFDGRINFEEAVSLHKDKPKNSGNQGRHKQDFGIETFSRIDIGEVKVIMTPFRIEDEAKDSIYDRDADITQTPRMPIPEPSESYLYRNPLELSSLHNETLSQFEEDYSVKISKDFPFFSPPDVVTTITHNSPDKQTYETYGRDKPKFITYLTKDNKHFQKDEYSFEFENPNSYYTKTRAAENNEKLVEKDSPMKSQGSNRQFEPLNPLLRGSPSDRKSEKSSSPERASRLLEEKIDSDRAFRLMLAATFKGHRNTVTALAKDPTNNSIFSGSLDGTILHWDADYMKKLHGAPHSSSHSGQDTRDSLKGIKTYKKPIQSLICNPFNRSIISGSSDSTIRIWNSQTYECSRILRGHSGGVFSLITLDTQHLVSGSGDQQIKLWDLEKGSLENSFQDHANRVTSLCRINSHDNFTFLSGSVDMTLKLWDSRINKSAAVFKEHEGAVNAIINLEDNQLASAGADGRIIIWDMLHRRIKDEYALDTEIYSLAYYKPAEKLLVGTDKLNVISLRDEKSIESFEDPSSHAGSVKSLLADSNLGRLYSGSFDTEIKPFNNEAASLLKG